MASQGDLIHLTVLCLLCAVSQERASVHASGLSLELKFANARLPIPQSEVAAVYDGHDTVYVMGGTDGPGSQLKNQVLKYSLDSDTLETLSDGPKLYGGVLFMSVDGEDLIYAGGHTVNGQTANLNYFSLSSQTSRAAGQMPSGTYYHSLAWDRKNGVAYMFGGHDDRAWNGRSEYLDRIVCYNTATATVEIVGRLPEARCCSAAVWADGAAYLFGGHQSEGDLEKDILHFDPEFGQVSKLSTKLPEDVDRSLAVYDELGKKVYILGADHLLRFDPLDQSVEIVEMDGWPNKFENTAGVYISKLQRIYFFGGMVRFQGQSSGTRTDKIMYIDLGSGPGSTRPEIQEMAHCELTICSGAKSVCTRITYPSIAILVIMLLAQLFTSSFGFYPCSSFQ